jgi:hypothetical protein
MGNSLILQHSPSRAGSPRPHTWILEWVVIILNNAPVGTRTQDFWLWYHIELHASTSSSQKFKLMRKGGQFTNTPTLYFGVRQTRRFFLQRTLNTHNPRPHIRQGFELWPAAYHACALTAGTFSGIKKLERFRPKYTNFMNFSSYFIRICRYCCKHKQIS